MWPELSAMYNCQNVYLVCPYAIDDTVNPFDYLPDFWLLLFWHNTPRERKSPYLLRSCGQTVNHSVGITRRVLSNMFID